MSKLFKKAGAAGKVGVPGFRARPWEGGSQPLTGIETGAPRTTPTAGAPPEGPRRRRRRAGGLGGDRGMLAPRTVMSGTY